MPRQSRNPLRKLRAGPWRGVLDTHDPGDDRQDFLADARNLYIPDPARGSGAYQRPGFSLQNSASQLGQSSSRRGQGIYTHIAADGAQYRFIACGGKIYRVDETLTVFTDVTPVGPTITSAAGSRVFFASHGDKLVVSDGTNRPWLGTDLASTPITGTNIQYDAGNSAWSAYGQPVVYGGALFVILNAVGGTSRRGDISWSEISDPATGYEQTNYDNNWTVTQTTAAPLFVLVPTNVALYYFREDSIGTIQGAVGPDLETQSTHDAVAFRVGSILPSTVVYFGNAIFFCDSVGRPYRLVVGEKPDPIWLQMRRRVDESSAGFPAVTQQTASATLEPTLNIYVAAIWSPQAASTQPCTELYAFEGHTGVYSGRWSIGAGMDVDCVGILEDQNGRAALVAVGSKTVGGESGYIWVLQSLIGAGSPLTEEDGDVLLTEDEGFLLGTEGTEQVWEDNGEVPTISATTHRLGYSADGSLLIDRAVAVTGSLAPCSVSAETPNTGGTAIGTATPAASEDDTYRMVWGPNVMGRGVELTVSPTTADTQWALHGVEIDALLVPAGAEEA